MGEKQNQPFQLSFNASLKVDFQGSRVTSDGGLILVRELDERLGFGELIEQHLTDSRRGKNTQLPFADLLRQSVYSRLAGYEDVNDAERLSQDPTFRLIGSEKIWDRGAALTSRLQTFETEMLAEEGNFAGLAGLNRALIGKAEAMDAAYRTVLDMDSTEIPVYGEQEQSAYNGHFESTCYHPLLLFNREGDCLAAKLRPATCTAPKAGKSSCCRRSSGSRGWGRKLRFGPTRPLPSRRFTRRWRARREICHPDPGQRQPGAGHRGTAAAPGGQAEQKAVGGVQGIPFTRRPSNTCPLLVRLVLLGRLVKESLAYPPTASHSVFPRARSTTPQCPAPDCRWTGCGSHTSRRALPAPRRPPAWRRPRRHETPPLCPASIAARSRAAVVLPSRRHCGRCRAAAWPPDSRPHG